MGKETRTVVINSERVGLAFLFYATGQSTLKVFDRPLGGEPQTHFQPLIITANTNAYTTTTFLFSF